jgi:hypothetical protein
MKEDWTLEQFLDYAMTELGRAIVYAHVPSTMRVLLKEYEAWLKAQETKP